MEEKWGVYNQIFLKNFSNDLIKIQALGTKKDQEEDHPSELPCL